MILAAGLRAIDLTIDLRFFIVVVYGIGATIAVASLLLMVQVVRMRRWRRVDEQRRLAFEYAWLPVVEGDTDETERLPRIGKRDLESFLIMMNDAQAYAALREGDDAAGVREHLRRLVGRLGLEPAIRRLVKKGSVEGQLVGITILGNIADAAELPVLDELTKSPNPVLSIAAAHARLHIDPAGARRFLELRLERSDWPPAKVDAVVEQERELLEPALLEGIFSLSGGERLVRYLAYCGESNAREAVARILESQADAATVAAALKVLAAFGGQGMTAQIAPFAAHGDWRVRVQAANALGSSGDPGRIPTLIPLVADREWWVRYRAAKAIADLGSEDVVRELRDGQEDRFAREMLSHVIAERDLERRRTAGKAA